MRITKLIIFGFGKFIQKEFDLAKDITLFFGENEAGKSTLRDFIVGILFGVEESEENTDQIDQYMLRKPWQGEEYGGKIELTVSGKSYIIERNFNKNKKKAVMRQVDTGEQSDIQFGKLDRETYLTIGCLSGQQISSDTELTSILSHYMAENIQEKSGEFDVEKAIQYLQQKRREISFWEQQNRISEIQKELEQIQEKESKLEELKRKENFDENLTEISQYMGVENDTIKEGDKISFYRRVTLGGLCILCLCGLVLQLYGFSLFCLLAVPVLGGLYYLTDQWIEEDLDSPQENKIQNIDESEWRTTLFFLQKRKEELKQQIDRRTELEQEYVRLKSEIELLLHQQKVLDLAQEKLNHAMEEVCQQFSYLLQEETSYIFEKMTGGKYKEVKIDEELKISVKDENIWIQSEYLSLGTMGQLDLSFRIAMSKLLFPDENIPIILDDIFVGLDFTRLRQTLDYLCSQGQQIILFSCNSEVRDYFEEKKKKIVYIS